ncbi:MAG: ester cyclase [Pseudomonadota bacterium]
MGDVMPVESRPARLVERFYNEVWNCADEAVAHEILHADFSFRGSLDAEKSGPHGFVDYMRAVHSALGEYRCEIVDLLETDLRVAARMRFVGRHQGVFFGVASTGRLIEWTGAAFFTTNRIQITDLWVLGDIDAVKKQLGVHADAGFEAS